MHTPFKYGIVSDYKPGYAKVYFQEDDLVTDWWPILMRTSLKDKESWPLNVQEQVICLCDDRLEEGVVLGAIHNDEDAPDPGAAAGKFRKVFEDGTILEYDKGTHEFKGTLQGKATIIAQGDVSITTITKVTIIAPEVDITGNLVVEGNLSFSGTMAGGSVGSSVAFDGTTLSAPEMKAGTVELRTHIHPAGTSDTGPPIA